MTTENDCQKVFEKCKLVLLDIAGTTTSLTFVKDTLFTFVTENIDTFLKENWENDDVKTALKLINDEKDVLDVNEASKLIKDCIEKQSNNIGLKTLNGFIYKKGYEDGSLKAHVYSDVPLAFTAWSKDRKIAIYSTGSIESQKLLFKHSVEGDLSINVVQYFDQSIGLKTQTESYIKIVKELNLAADEVLWISDLEEELKAAREAGLLTILINRGPKEDITTEFLTITSLAELIIDTSNNKRKNEGDNEVPEDEPPSKVSKNEVDENDKKDSVEVKDNIENPVDSDKNDAVQVPKTDCDIKQSSNGSPSETVEVDKAETKVFVPEELKTTETVVEMEVESIVSNVSTAETNNASCSNLNETVAEKMETDEMENTTDVETIIRTVTQVKSPKPADSDINQKTENVMPIETETEKEVIIEDTMKTDNLEIADIETTTVTENAQVLETNTQDPSKVLNVNETLANSTIQIENNTNNTDAINDNLDSPSNVQKVVVPEIKLDANDITCTATGLHSGSDTISITKVLSLTVAENDTSLCDGSKELKIEKKDSTAECFTETIVPNKCAEENIEDSALKIEQVCTEKIPEPNLNNANETKPEISVTDLAASEKTEELDINEKCSESKLVADETSVISESITSPILEETSSQVECLDKDAEVTSTVENITNGKALHGKENGTKDCEVDVDNTITNGQEKSVEAELQDEVKVKKIDTSVDSTAVSIEA